MRFLSILFVSLGTVLVPGTLATVHAQVKPRIVIGFDTSGSMGLDLDGNIAFGDGVTTGCSIRTSPNGRIYYCGTNCTAGLDTDCDGEPNDSRIAIAKDAVRNMVLAFGDVDWGLARFGQLQGVGISCPNINDLECNGYITSVGNPQCNTGPAIPNGTCPFDLVSGIPDACEPGLNSNDVHRMYATGSPEVCLNYAGGCAPGDVLVGFPNMGPFSGLDNTLGIVSWLDGQETNFVNTTTTGNFCNSATNGDCELRATGATPLDGLLGEIESYITPIRAADPASACRPYSVILLTDGDEQCGGDPAAAAASLLANGIRTYVVGLAISATSRANLNAIATAGGTDAGAPGGDTAFFADDPNTLSAGLADIVRRSLLIETCNNADDDCDGMVDEGFQKYCDRDNGVTTTTLCSDPGDDCDGSDDNCFNGVADEPRNLCGTCGAPPTEVCDGLDNDCDTVIDEGGVCSGCVPSAEICDGLDNDCDGSTDESLTRPCGVDVGECSSGTETCNAGTWGACTGTGPSPEVCDGLDNDCDGAIDGINRPCGTNVGECSEGTERCTAGAWSGTCVGGVDPSAELCDGRDNDCDGATDEGNPGGGGPCGSNIGACSRGNLVCSGGALVCAGGTGPSTETCNSIDDDCDGNTDESVATMGPCGSAVGECREGVLSCVMGTFQCVGGRSSVPEICDGRDNDCDGSTDEGNPGGGVACGTDTGICELGMTRCMGGALICVGGVAPEVESCDGSDNDCDGLVDEGNPGGGGSCGSTDVGECEFGAEACVGGTLVCRGATGPSAEICDGLDNDCDGSTDEGNPESGAPCGDSTGECEPGTTACVGGSLVCMGGVGPTEEICDGLDNDCDGVEDEGLGVGAPCGSDTGECSPGVNVCRMGTLVCEGEIAPTGETCDGLDNDCDGIIDESLPLGAACGSMEGLCMEGSLQCIDGTEVCVGEVPPSREGCDCEDNDCDGNVDEAPDSGSLCPEGSTCVECACSLPCQTSEFGFTCPSGKTPFEDGTGTCFCVTPRCDATTCAGETVERDGDTLCSPDEGTPTCTCRNNACTFPCDGVVCMGGTVCHPDTGRCVEDSCRSLGCPDGEVCDVATGACEADPCASVSCEATQACRDGVCEATCADVECNEGEVCHAGACEVDLCASVSCPAGDTCDPSDGSCVENLCVDVRCPFGSECDPLTGDCESDPCNRLHCPDDQVCVDGECYRREAMPDGGMVDGGADAGGDAGPGTTDELGDRVLATGGGGCACAVPGAVPSEMPLGPLGLALALLGLVAWRRRRRSIGKVAAALAAGAVAVLAGGCDVEPFCLTCVDGGVDAALDAGFDAGGRDAARPDVGVDSGPGDAGPDACLPTETCNEADDDCDGEIDEGIDLASDVNNCGTCGNECAPAHAFGTCIDASCAIGTCDVGWHDLNGDLDDGCEYRCLATDDDDAVCDLRDNDCDGNVDEDVDLDNDPVNCGACGRICRFAHVTNPRCTTGDCTFDPAADCESGFYDVNGVPDDGCEYACTPADPATETCNGRDDDCDGAVDEGDPGGGAACGSNIGACRRGVNRCVDGAIVCSGETAPETESCNGIDDDCDGTTDENNPDGGRLCGESVGTCELGREACVGGALVCQGDTGPVAEVCDGLDNDCDGSIDEGNPGGGAACGETRGECSAGRLNCRGGVLACEGAVGPTTEVCDGRDNDCDGSTDEGNPGGGGTCGTDVGACLPGTRQCMGGSLVCVGATSGSAETCNNIDDDCDGSIDEGNPDGGGACGITTGECSAGTQVCLGGTLVCQGGTGPSAETCNSRDDDCDGSTDETFDFDNDLNNCGTCGNTCSFPHGVAQCVARSCTLVGCTAGWVDADGSASNGCEYNCTVAGAEICNGSDDDCDGSTDEGLTPPANFCNPNGVCAGTTASCGGASGWECSYPASFEDTETTCDGLDNDCDGAVDEPFPLKGTACTNGVGACQTSGIYVCTAAMDAVVCNAPPPLPGTAERCNARDDDCDGNVDENPGTLIPTVTVPRSGGGTVEMMVYEASHPDATSANQGAANGYACSNPNVLPWTNLTWTEAQAACQGLGAGWDLCEETDWQTACEGPSGTCAWSYATSCASSAPLTCNGDEYDSSPAPGDQDQLFQTGRSSTPFNACYVNWGGGDRIYDLSGNVKEWTRTSRGPGLHAIRGGSYNNVEAGRRCDFDFTVGDGNFAFVNTGFRCCRY